MDNDLTYPEVSITYNGFHLSRLLPFFLRAVGVGRCGGKVIIRRDYRGELQKNVLSTKKRLCKYYVTENVFCI